MKKKLIAMALLLTALISLCVFAACDEGKEDEPVVITEDDTFKTKEQAI